MPRPTSLVTLEPRRVCLIKPSSLGDIVHATPTFNALRDRWPSARFAWVVNRSLASLVHGLPGLDEVIPFDRQAAGRFPTGGRVLARTLADLHRRRFDLTIDLQGLFRSALLTVATAAPVRVGLADAREAAHLAYTHRIPVPSPPAHAVDRLLRVAAAFGACCVAPRFAIPATPDDHDWASHLLRPLRRPRLILNIGARWTTKRWPPQHFAEVGRSAVEQRGASLIAVGAPEDRPLVDALKLALDPIPVLDLCGRTSLPRLAALAAACDLFLSNDTGPLHLAVAAGASTLAVFTCTDPRRTGPYSPSAAVVSTRLPCAASCLKVCGHLSCMTELEPRRVWLAVQDQLDQATHQASSAA
ncbi:MAG: lipopolysaccharide heptosyltransferase I [Isosphaeraceae bacterium]|jgi:lipopolysaccharide heptosyltransferase II|nr:MAG: lipopolysaccharide heptosyltransferase I [Isosphaeraceae bacterium]